MSSLLNQIKPNIDSKSNKKRVGRELNSDAMIADANCTKVCMQLSVILLVSMLEIFASSFKKIIPKDCLIISPTLNCLCVIGFPILLILYTSLSNF